MDTRITLKFDQDIDGELLSWLETKDNKEEFIKTLVRNEKEHNYYAENPKKAWIKMMEIIQKEDFVLYMSIPGGTVYIDDKNHVFHWKAPQWAKRDTLFNAAVYEEKGKKQIMDTLFRITGQKWGFEIVEE